MCVCRRPLPYPGSVAMQSFGPYSFATRVSAGIRSVTKLANLKQLNFFHADSSYGGRIMNGIPSSGCLMFRKEIQVNGPHFRHANSSQSRNVDVRWATTCGNDNVSDDMARQVCCPEMDGWKRLPDTMTNTITRLPCAATFVRVAPRHMRAVTGSRVHGNLGTMSTLSNVGAEDAFPHHNP